MYLTLTSSKWLDQYTPRRRIHIPSFCFYSIIPIIVDWKLFHPFSSVRPVAPADLNSAINAWNATVLWQWTYSSYSSLALVCQVELDCHGSKTNVSCLCVCLLFCICCLSPCIEPSFCWCPHAKEHFHFDILMTYYIALMFSPHDWQCTKQSWSLMFACSLPSLAWVCSLWSYQTFIPMKITVLKSAVVPSRISGSGETGANHLPSKPTLMVMGQFFCISLSMT